MNVEKLPHDAQIKLQRLQQRRYDLEVLLRGTQKNIENNEARCTRLANLRTAAGSEEQARDYHAKLEAARDEHERLVQLRARRDSEMREAAQTAMRVEEFVERLKDTAKVRLVPKRGATYSSGRLDDIRGVIAKVEADLQSAECAPLDRQSIEQAVTQTVNEMAAAVCVDVEGVRGEPSAWPPVARREFPLGLTLSVRKPVWRVPQPVEIAAFCNPQGLIERTLAAIPDEPGMSQAEKAETKARLDAQLLALERQEEALIEAAESDGHDIERRSTANPLAILHLTLTAEQEAQAA